MKTSELTGLALDWAVTAIENPDALKYGVEDWRSRRRHDVKDGEFLFRWSSSWAQGGPIIERERITLDGTAILNQWMAVFYVPDEEPWEMRGPTPLIAAMRCYVASRLGEEVDVPEELQ